MTYSAVFRHNWGPSGNHGWSRRFQRELNTDKRKSKPRLGRGFASKLRNAMKGNIKWEPKSDKEWYKPMPIEMARTPIDRKWDEYIEQTWNRPLPESTFGKETEDVKLVNADTHSIWSNVLSRPNCNWGGETSSVISDQRVSLPTASVEPANVDTHSVWSNVLSRPNGNWGGETSSLSSDQQRVSLPKVSVPKQNIHCQSSKRASTLEYVKMMRNSKLVKKEVEFVPERNVRRAIETVDNEDDDVIQVIEVTRKTKRPPEVIDISDSDDDLDRAKESPHAISPPLMNGINEIILSS
ncbi:hypothetical protein HDE_04901 [Halotydeus destructor]|nr:hypothetical protein HDE_04901 [Halotydeus destructor]